MTSKKRVNFVLSCNFERFFCVIPTYFRRYLPQKYRRNTEEEPLKLLTEHHGIAVKKNRSEYTSGAALIKLILLFKLQLFKMYLFLVHFRIHSHTRSAKLLTRWMFHPPSPIIEFHALFIG
jgi:hypothetical protein